MQVVDANNVTQDIVVQIPVTPTDRSGTIQATDVSQVLMDAVAEGSFRAGWIVQNKSQTGTTMQVNDLGDDADQSPTSIDLAPGESWPPPGYPVTQGPISIAGAAGDNFMAREW